MLLFQFLEVNQGGLRFVDHEPLQLKREFKWNQPIYLKLEIKFPETKTFP